MNSKRRFEFEMKKILILASLAVFALSLSALAGRGNDLPSGPHYNLNIIGSPKDKDVGDSEGHTLFVKLDGKTRILMTQAEDGEFRVTDRNGTDGTAEFNIAPGYYNVFARALGRPLRHVIIESGGIFEDAEQGDRLIWLGMVRLDREKGKPQTVNINELFWVDVTLCTAVDPDGNCTETTEYTDTWVFDIEELLEYFWDYDNYGLKLLQVRFYACTIDPTGQAPDYCRWGDGTPIEPGKKVIVQ